MLDFHDGLLGRCRTRCSGVSLVVVMTLATACGAGMLAQTPASGSVRDGVYTAAQAEQGQAVYDDLCVSCHGPMRAIVPEMAALLADHTFRTRWRGRSLGELFELIRETMPQDAPGTLSTEQTAALIAYILSGNRLAAGGVALSDDVAQLSRISFEP